MIEQGFALERISTGEELRWWKDLPLSIKVPGELITVDGAQVGWEFDDFRLVEKEKEYPDPEPEPEAEVPPVDRPRIEKSLVIERLTDKQLELALSSMSTRQKERWRMPGHPWVYKDDPEVLGLLQAIGASPEVVLA